MYLKWPIIVEGKDDESLIKSLLDSHVIKTNGFDLCEDDILFLNKLSKIAKIIVLTDSDEAGEKIRDNINRKVSNTLNVFVDKKYCNKNGKHGVAECDKNHLLDVLGEYIVLESPKINKLSKNDLSELGLNGDSNSKENRLKICKAFSLGKCNAKTMLERLNMLDISYEEIEEELNKNGD